jgi:hypothetical protein
MNWSHLIFLGISISAGMDLRGQKAGVKRLFRGGDTLLSRPGPAAAPRPADIRLKRQSL